jgi:tRNA dimethylallyltransferase
MSGALSARGVRGIERPAEDELLVIVGPTASGKTDLAIELAEGFGGEVVGADSVQIYRAFDIGSGKPTAAEMARAPHHLVDLFDPLDTIDAQRYAELASGVIGSIRARGRVPIVCGGAFLWVKALVWGLAKLPAASPEVRAAHEVVVREGGRAALHARLAEVDPSSAARLSPNDYVRVSRALEVYEVSGKPQSAWHAEHNFRAVQHKARLIGVDRGREELDRRIELRTKAWLDEGWIDEVRSLIERGYRDARAMGSVGYKQVLDHIEGRLPREELLPAIVRATRVFVRRQRTWLRDQAVTYVPG